MRFCLPGNVRAEMCRNNQGCLVNQQRELREHIAALQVCLGEEAEALRHDGLQRTMCAAIGLLDLRYLRNPVVIHSDLTASGSPACLIRRGNMGMVNVLVVAGAPVLVHPGGLDPPPRGLGRAMVMPVYPAAGSWSRASSTSRNGCRAVMLAPVILNARQRVLYTLRLKAI